VVLLVEMLVLEFRSESDVVFGDVNFSTLLAFAVVVDIDKRGFLPFLDKLLSRLLSFSLHRRRVAGAVVKDGEDDEGESVVKLLRFKFFLALDVVLTVVDMFSGSLLDDKIADSLNPGMRFTSVLDLKIGLNLYLAYLILIMLILEVKIFCRVPKCLHCGGSIN
jgi:hypothetical protein